MDVTRRELIQAGSVAAVGSLAGQDTAARGECTVEDARRWKSILEEQFAKMLDDYSDRFGARVVAIEVDCTGGTMIPPGDRAFVYSVRLDVRL